jgi:hypothetical protein
MGGIGGVTPQAGQAVGMPMGSMPMQPGATPTPTPDILAQAKQMYPVLNNPNIYYKYSPRASNTGNYLETYPVGESGGPNDPRPKEFPMDKPGIEVYRKDTRPIDVLGDAVSHLFVNTDPTIKKYYQDFQKSLTPAQQKRLQEQYQYAQKNEGEERPYEQWLQISGLPSYFRGYAFKQWPNMDDPKVQQQFYTPEQIKQFDAMMQYLSGKQGNNK